MLELGQKAAPPAGPANADLIKDATEASFMADVIEASREVPVIVDFWAPWCGPCKTLGPAIEAAVIAAKGKVRLVKIDVDQSPRISAQLRIQSIPTVYAFWQGQPVDGFQGAIPGSEIKAFIDKLSGLAGDGGLAEALETAETMLAEGATTDAAEVFSAILEEDGNNAVAFGGLARSRIAAGDLDQAEAMLASAPAAIANAAAVEAAKAQLALARQAADAGPLGELEAALARDPSNHQARYDLATALHAAGRIEEAIDQLLELFRRDREWNGAAAKSQLLTIFDAMKPTDPLVLRGRRRLSSMIFA